MPFDNVEATFDIVERIVKLVAFDNVVWTLLLVSTGLKSHDKYLVTSDKYTEHGTSYIFRWRGGASSKALDLRSTGRGFKSYSGQSCITTLGKLFTPMCLCHQAI